MKNFDFYDLGVMENAPKEAALKALAKRVKELRNLKGASQLEAFNDTGIHFARIEQGKRDINYTSLIRICEYFEISIKDFFRYF